MVQTKFEAFAFLSNVDESIMKIRLPEGYQLRKIILTELEGVKDTIFGNSTMIGILQELTNKHILDNNNAYYVYLTEVVDTDPRFNGFDYLPAFVEKIDVLRKRLNLLKLYHEGDVRIPLSKIKMGHYPGTMATETFNYISYEKFKVGADEIDRISTILSSDIKTLKNLYLSEVFSLFEQSYTLPDLNFQFLTSMICLEMLFNPGESEVSYRISRNCAVFIGGDEEESRRIFCKIRALYNHRSSYAHRGVKGKIKPEDILFLRDVIRRSLTKLDSMPNFDKTALLSRLDGLGFGEGKRLIP